MDNLACLSSFFYSYCFSTVFLVYLIKLPFLLTRETDIVNEYYGKKFVSSLHFNNIYATQFHPEKSHEFGEKLLLNFASIKND